MTGKLVCPLVMRLQRALLHFLLDRAAERE